MKKILLLLILVSAFSTRAQSFLKQSTLAQQDLQRRGEVYFSFQLKDLILIPSLSQKISISHTRDNKVFAYANQREFSDFTAYNIEYSVLTAPSELYSVDMSNNPAEILEWNYYPTYAAYETLMQQFASEHPEICKLITITTLASGRKILALRISDHVNEEENEPEFLYTSSIHGDELTGFILMLHLADSLLSGYGSSSRITRLVDNFDIVICPLANPDGTYKGGNNTVNGATRYNANNIDLNRNFPDPKTGPHPDGNQWQPENIAFMDFAAQHTFTMGANFHGGAEVVNYPWDTWSKLAADDAWWILISREFADTIHAYAPAGYLTDEMNGITNGYSWYEVNGGRQDYMNFFHYCREATIEISATKLPAASQLNSFWKYNYRSLLNYMEQSGYGIHGLVTDSATGAALYAKVYISGFDKDSSHVFTDPEVGDYHRLLKAGTYQVTYSASGYTPKTVTVTVNDRQSTELNVRLTSTSLGIEEQVAGKNSDEIHIYPNPVTHGIATIEAICPIEELIVRDLAGRLLLSKQPCANKLSFDCPWPAGIYFIQVKLQGRWEFKKIQVN